MIILDDMGDHDPDLYITIKESMIDAAQVWCQQAFNQDWAHVKELGDIPIIYNENLHGYYAIVEMPDYPQRVQVEIFLSPDDPLVVRIVSV